MRAAGADAVGGDAALGGDVMVVAGRVQALVAQMAAAVAADRVGGGDLLEFGEVLSSVITQVQALHSAVTAQVMSSGMWAVAGYPSAQGWLRISQRLDGRAAARATANAAWLSEHTVVRQAFEQGAISLAHVDAIRRVAGSTPARRESFPEFAAALVDAAIVTDPARLGQVMRAWAEVVDDEGSNRDAEDDHQSRRVFLSPVCEGWDLRGWLPAAQGAELAGILNEIVSAARREDPTTEDAAPARRADALLDLARTAAAAGLTRPNATARGSPCCCPTTTYAAAPTAARPCPKTC